MITGHDFLLLGHARFNVQVCINGVRPGSMGGCFAHTWKESPGDSLPKAKKCLRSAKFIQWRTQGFWSYQHKPAPLSVVVKEAKRWANLQQQTGKKIYFSPSCEYDSSTPKKLVEQWVKAIQKVSLVPVLTPMGGPVIPGVLVERHGDKVMGARAVSLDGQSFADCDAAKLIKDNPDAEYLLAWKERYNGSAGKNNPPPIQRTEFPSVEYVQGLDALFNPCVYGELKAPQLYKIYAEEAPNDTRSNRPLLMLKEKAPFVEILDSKNNVLGKFMLYKDSHPHDLERYYSNVPGGMQKYAFQISDLAYLRSGSSIIKARINGKVYVIGTAEHRHDFYQT